MAFLQAPLLKNRSAGLDLLRVALALWVVSIHLIPAAEIVQPGTTPALATWLTGKLYVLFQTRGETHPAVLAFIVLSGYCIHRNGIREHHADLRAYAIRRIFRIYPVYLLGLLLGITALAWTKAAAPAIAAVVTGTDTASGGCVAAKLIGLPALLPAFFGCALLGNTPLSTVVVELCLYAAYPVLLLLVARKVGDRGIWCIIALLWVTQFSAVMVSPDLAQWWHNSSFFGYLPAWWIGAKFVETRVAMKIGRYVMALFITWILLSLILLRFHHELLIVVEARKLVFAMLVGLLISFVDRHQVANRFDFGALGKAGYSLYAMHAPIIYTALVLGAPWWVAGSSAILAGMLSYWAIEEPMLRLGRTIAFRLRPAHPSGEA